MHVVVEVSEEESEEDEEEDGTVDEDAGVEGELAPAAEVGPEEDDGLGRRRGVVVVLVGAPPNPKPTPLPAMLHRFRRDCLVEVDGRRIAG